MELSYLKTTIVLSRPSSTTTFVFTSKRDSRLSLVRKESNFCLQRAVIVSCRRSRTPRTANLFAYQIIASLALSS